MTEEMEHQELDIETRARMMGHVPMEEFKGDPEKWVDAETFVARAEEELPIARGTIKTLERKLEKTEQRLSQLSSTLEDFNKYHQTTLQREQARAAEEYQRGLSEAQAQMREAVELGDTEMFDDAKAKQDKLIKEASALGEAGEDNGRPKIDPEINRQWVEEHTWFKSNFKMHKYAKECGDFLAMTQPELNQKQQLEKIAEMVKEEFSDYFSNPNRNKADAVSGGDNTAAPAGGRRRTVNDLPKVARELLEGFKRDIKGFTDAQFLAQYTGPWKS
jgi:hypothetical protein